MPKVKVQKPTEKANSPYKKPGVAKPASEYILPLASKVALEVSQEIQWSSWHIWQDCLKFDKWKRSLKHDVDRYKKDWRKAQSFGTCVDQARAARLKLKHAIANHERNDIRSLANKVQLYALWDKCDDGEWPAHVLCALLLPKSCIVIDLFSDLDAFSVLLDEPYDGMNDINWDGEYNCDTYYYAKEGDECVLRQDGFFSRDGERFPAFAPITYYDAITKTNFRLGRAYDDKANGIPTRRYIRVNSFMTKQPKDLDCCEIDGGWLVVGMRMSIDYLRRTILIQMPHREYLGLKRNKHILLALRRVKEAVIRVNQIVTNVLLDCKKLKGVLDPTHLTPFIDLVQDMGMPEEDFVKIAWSVASYNDRS